MSIWAADILETTARNLVVLADWGPGCLVQTLCVAVNIGYSDCSNCDIDVWLRSCFEFWHLSTFGAGAKVQRQGFDDCVHITFGRQPKKSQVQAMLGWVSGSLIRYAVRNGAWRFPAGVEHRTSMFTAELCPCDRHNSEHSGRATAFLSQWVSSAPYC